jgi:hypothetical protein
MGQTLAGYVRGAQLGAAGGVATLGEDGKLALAQRPPIDLIDVWPVASEAQMLALADATAGDFAVRSDNGLVYVLQHPPASELANWLEISTPAPVSSVNGKVGAVGLGAGDVGAAPAGRQVRTQGPLLGGGGALTGDLTLTLTPASVEEATAGAAADRVVTPASLSRSSPRWRARPAAGRRSRRAGCSRAATGSRPTPRSGSMPPAPKTSSRAPPATGRSRPPRWQACRAASPPMAGSPCRAGSG